MNQVWMGSDDEGDADMEDALPGHKVRFRSLLPSPKRPSLFSLKGDGPGGGGLGEMEMLCNAWVWSAAQLGV